MWKEAYALGIPEIDEQHAKLVTMVMSMKDLINDAEDGVDCYDEMEALFRELQNYTAVHFADEEKYMADKGFEGLKAHKELHDAFIERVDEFMETDIDADQLSVIEEVAQFLLDWVVSHIINEDRKYMLALNQ